MNSKDKAESVSMHLKTKREIYSNNLKPLNTALSISLGFFDMNRNCTYVPGGLEVMS